MCSLLIIVAVVVIEIAAKVGFVETEIFVVVLVVFGQFQRLDFIQ